MAAPGPEAIRSSLAAFQAAVAPRTLQTIAILGAASEGRRLTELCSHTGIKVAALVDDHPAKVGTELNGIPVRSFAAFDQIDRSVPIIIASHRVLGATEKLRAMGFQSVMPFAALEVAAPDRFPPHMFYDGLIEDLWEHRDRYAQLHGMLADQRSRDVLDAVLAFRQTLDPATLRPVLDEDDLYAPKGLFRFSDREVYVEGGAYDGDTIATFIARVNGRFERVYAFEPDPLTFARLSGNFAQEPRVSPIHAGLHRSTGVLRFRDDASRGAIFASDGEIEMPVTSIDETLDGKRVTYIKMNIEGAEIDALEGARKTIQTWMPKLAISVYHRPSDLWRIPALVKDLSEQYELYLRQHDGGIIETVLYALPRGEREN